MAKVIDALVVTLGLDPSGYKKGAAQAQAAQASLKQSAQQGATATTQATQQAGTAQNNLAQQQRQHAQATARQQRAQAQGQRTAQYNWQSYANTVTSQIRKMAFAAAEMVLGFNTVKGALNAYVGATNQLANLGRVAPTVGTDVQALDKLGDAYKMVGGKADEAGSDIAKLSHAQFSFAINAPDAMAGWARRLGVSLFDEKGNPRDKIAIQEEIAASVKRQTSDLSVQANYAREMGLSESFIQLYLVKQASERAKILRDTEKTALANERNAAAAIAEEQARARIRNTLKSKGQQIVAATAPALAAAENHIADAARSGNWTGLSKSSVRGLAYNERLGFKAWTGGYVRPMAKAEEKYGLPAGLLARVANAESNFNPNARSKSGAVGLMQLMPGTFKGAGKDPISDIDTAGKELGRLLAIYRKILPEAQALDATLKAYNGGQGNVNKILAGQDPYHNGGKLLPETAAYPSRVLQYSGYVQDSTAPLAGPGAPKNSLMDRGNSTQVHIEQLNVHTQATDAPGIAATLPDALRRQNLVAQGNSGLQ